MSWNYRIVRLSPDYCGIHEVYYDKDGNPESVTESAARFGGESIEEIRSALEKAAKALDKPILDYKTLKEIK